MPLSPITIKRFRRFRSIRRGWWSILLLAAILVASTLSLAFFGLVGALERRLIFWR